MSNIAWSPGHVGFAPRAFPNGSVYLRETTFVPFAILTSAVPCGSDTNVDTPARPVPVRTATVCPAKL
ncbi:hypothetical protein GCM10023221_35690 [Luteimicrobium xylanilyticum]